jgi:hypothetical protein
MYIQGVLFPLEDEFVGAKIAGYFSPSFPFAVSMDLSANCRGTISRDS